MAKRISSPMVEAYKQASIYSYSKVTTELVGIAQGPEVQEGDRMRYDAITAAAGSEELEQSGEDEAEAELWNLALNCDGTAVEHGDEISFK